MTSENTALAIDLTQAILEQFWQQDTSLLLKYIDEDFSLTDALNNSIIQGQQQVCNFIPTAISGIIKSTLTDKMFIIAQNSDSDDMVYMKQYCVFIWELSGLGELKLKHIGVTKPDSMSESVYGNAFNSAMIPTGSALNQQNCSLDRMIITDTDDCTRFIPRNDILYATSDGRNCQICCFSGIINARINISQRLTELFSNK